VGARREARIAALKGLYARELGGEKDIQKIERQVLEFHLVPETAKIFFNALFEETLSHIGEIDKAIEERAQNWALDRISVIDRNIIRLGVAELLFFPDIPAKTTINECIELAKIFGTSESARFVNGLLDGILRHTDNEKAGQLLERK